MFCVSRPLQLALTACFVVLIGACASNSPAPNFIYGRYYMTGDSNCVRASAWVEGRIRCFNSEGKYTGYRVPMTLQEMQMYNLYQQEQQRQIGELTQQLNQTGASFQRAGQSAPQYTPPVVQPIPQPGQGQVRCITAGIYTNCRY